jgi:hypothetical protein
MLNREIRDQILNSLLQNITAISDKEYQMRIWIQGEGPEVDDFDETACNFFQDVRGVLSQYRAFGINKTQYTILMRFMELFDRFCNQYAIHYVDENQFINTTEWQQIVDEAKKVLEVFNFKKT